MKCLLIIKYQIFENCNRWKGKNCFYCFTSTSQQNQRKTNWQASKFYTFVYDTLAFGLESKTKWNLLIWIMTENGINTFERTLKPILLFVAYLHFLSHHRALDLVFSLLSGIYTDLTGIGRFERFPRRTGRNSLIVVALQCEKKDGIIQIQPHLTYLT